MKKDTIFELIKSMTQNEKRYFKRYSTLHSENKDNIYVSLFEKMDSMKKFNEHLLFDGHSGAVT